MDSQTLRYYESYAEKAARRYEGAEAGIAALFPFVFQRGERVLDIGAGSGRDAARLLHLGVDVQAVEPSSSLSRFALAAHPELQGRLFDGFLPGGLPPECQREYDGILLSAVIMHIPDGELFDAAFELRARLAKGGKLLVSLPIQRDDVRPGEERDDAGRLMVMRSVAQVRLLFERLGFQLENDYKSADSLGRPDFSWASLYFRAPEATGATTRAIDRVESIINADRKVATYKLALVRALCDIAMTSWAVAKWEPGGRAVSVPLAAVSEKWQQYYWPLLDGDQVIPQINAERDGGKPMAFRGKLAALITECRRAGGLSAFSRMQAEGTLSAAAARLSAEAIRVIGSTIVKGPVKYAGGARGETEFAFDAGTGRIVLQADVWRELSLMGHWIRDAVILRWAEMSSRLSKGAIATGTVIDKLLQSAEPWRADPDVRGVYEGMGGLACVWTARQLRSDFDVDHAIPFVFWQASPSWNLFPAAKTVNNAKRDRVPTSDLIRRREEAIVGCWRLLEARMPVRFKRDTASLLGGDPGVNWEKALLGGFLEAVEYTASVRGAERWEPE